MERDASRETPQIQAVSEQVPTLRYKLGSFLRLPVNTASPAPPQELNRKSPIGFELFNSLSAAQIGEGVVEAPRIAPVGCPEPNRISLDQFPTTNSPTDRLNK